MSLGPKAKAKPKKLLLTDASSLVDLKAEVFRKAKEAEFNRRHGSSAIVGSSAAGSSSSAASVCGSTTSNKIWSKASIGLDKKKESKVKDYYELKEKEEESRRALERKAKLYDQMKEGRHSEHSDRFLVQFNNDRSSSSSSSSSDGEADPGAYEAKDEDEEWIEYRDALGRTRTCMKKDLPKLRERDRELEAIERERARDRMPAPAPPDDDDDDLEALEPRTDLLSEDMRRELLRQKWEREEEENLQKRSVHYQDMLFDEARTHGAGYYKFSRDEVSRTEQKDELDRLHEETVKARSMAKKQKKKRKAALEKRLKMVRDKKRRKLGLPVKDDSSSSAEESEDDSDGDEGAKKETMDQKIMNSLREMREQVEADTIRKKSIREWDLGKEGMPDKMPAELLRPKERKVLSQEEWVSKKRDNRANEFAPPSSYEPTQSGKSKRKVRAADPAPNTMPSTSSFTSPPPPVGCDVSKPPPVNAMQQLEEDDHDVPIGPVPIREEEEQAVEEGREPFNPLRGNERLQMHSIHRTGAIGGITEEPGRRDDSPIRGKGAEVAPPSDLEHYPSMRGYNETYRKGFRSHEAMAEAFHQGLNKQKKRDDAQSSDDNSD